MLPTLSLSVRLSRNTKMDRVYIVNGLRSISDLIALCGRSLSSFKRYLSNYCIFDCIRTDQKFPLWNRLI